MRFDIILQSMFFPTPPFGSTQPLPLPLTCLVAIPKRAKTTSSEKNAKHAKCNKSTNDECVREKNTKGEKR